MPHSDEETKRRSAAPSENEDGGGAAAPGPTRREREHEAHRELILRVAESVFARRGYPGATIAEIARRAEFSVGSIYNFFPGKRELGEAVMMRICRERVESIRAQALPLASDPPAGLDALLRLWTHHHAEHGAFVRMSIEYQRSIGKSEPPETFRRLFAEYIEIREAFFAAGAPSGWYRELPPSELGRVFEGVCHEYLFEWSRATPRRPESELLDRLRAVVPVVLRR